MDSQEVQGKVQCSHWLLFPIGHWERPMREDLGWAFRNGQPLDGEGILLRVLQMQRSQQS